MLELERKSARLRTARLCSGMVQSPCVVFAHGIAQLTMLQQVVRLLQRSFKLRVLHMFLNHVGAHNNNRMVQSPCAFQSKQCTTGKYSGAVSREASANPRDTRRIASVALQKYRLSGHFPESVLG